MTAATGWKPPGEALASRVCAAAACGREFRPKHPADRFCSPRCERIKAEADGITHPNPPAPPAPQPVPIEATMACAHCGKPFTPKAQGWQAKYCQWSCVRAHGATEATPEPEATLSAPPAEAEAETVSVIVDDAGDEPPDDDHEQVTLAPPPPPRIDSAGYAVGHEDGFRSGLRVAAELTSTLMRSPAFRDLDQDTAIEIVVEALS